MDLLVTGLGPGDQVLPVEFPLNGRQFTDPKITDPPVIRSMAGWNMDHLEVHNPIKTSIHKEFSIAMFDYQRVDELGVPPILEMWDIWVHLISMKHIWNHRPVLDFSGYWLTQKCIKMPYQNKLQILRRKNSRASGRHQVGALLTICAVVSWKKPMAYLWSPQNLPETVTLCGHFEIHHFRFSSFQGPFPGKHLTTLEPLLRCQYLGEGSLLISQLVYHHLTLFFDGHPWGSSFSEPSTSWIHKTLIFCIHINHKHNHKHQFKQP